MSVRRPKELTAAAPGFYIALGDAESAGSRGDVEVRVYFNVSPAGTAPLVGACTRRLNDARIPFILKVLDHPAGFTRCDPAILYLEAGGFDRAREALSAIASACSPRLRRELPTFTKPLASGVSVGEHRLGLGEASGAVAAGWLPRASSPRTNAVPLTSLIASMRWPAASRITVSISTPRTWRNGRAGAMSSDEAPFLELAGLLGREIASSAIWSGGRCNWVGDVGRDETRLSGRAELAALGPDLYGGTSGVALFLAEAGARLASATLQATALGAIRLALDQAGQIAPDVRDGLYGGSIGVAYAAVRVAALLQAEDVHARARTLLLAWRADATRSGSSDLMTGCSGAVLGLVVLNRLVPEPWVVDEAARLGDELIARADVRPAGWSWADPKQTSMHNLCGYMHGAAGIGHALAELGAVTGEARFREAAFQAFDYERSWFDAQGGAWPDLRGAARRAGRDVLMPISDSWCNGAFGIALSRLRAADLFGSEHLRREAGIGVAMCRRHVAELLVSIPDDFSLCHGAAGAADVLLHAATGRDDLADRLARRGIELYAPGRTLHFPCGVLLGETPGLLLGLSGVGMFYLRLCEPGMQSPLLIHCPRTG